MHKITSYVLTTMIWSYSVEDQ